MTKIQNSYRSIRRHYRLYLYVVFLIGLLIYLIGLRHLSELQLEDTTDTNNNNKFDLFDDDDLPFICSAGSQFNISNRQHLAILASPKLESFVWKNFRALLCTGVDAYIMLDEVFDINSSLRGDDFQARTNRSLRSYTHRFVHIPNEQLAKYGVSYMSKHPQVRYTSWDRVIVWLYQRRDLKTAWVIDYKVQWFYVQNMTNLFNLYTTDTSDILCSDIVPINSKSWKQWPKTKSDIFPKSYWMGTFSPLVRWSRRLLLHHYRYMQLIHVDRLKYEFDHDFRFQEFLLATIANIEKLSIALYNERHQFIQISLGNYNDKDILGFLQRGKHIIYPISHESVLTKYRTEEIVEMMNKI